MEAQFRFILLFLLIIALAFLACDRGKKDNNNNLLLMLFTDGPSAGDMETYTAEDVSFHMSLVPGGQTFPTGGDDGGTATVTNAYRISDSEVTYEQWKKVYDWATDAARGSKKYTFANVGRQGDNGSRGIQHPVTMVNWRSAMVWCNALTEWCNAKTYRKLTCVYYKDGTYMIPLRDSTDGAYSADVNPNDGGFDSPYIMARTYGNLSMDACCANGFRLPTANEWELAARFRDGTLWTYGDHASGDNSGYCYYNGNPIGGMPLSTVFGDYAVYNGNSGSTAVVRSKKNGYNGVWLWDMSGNVWEWCFDWCWFGVGSSRVFRGGSWSDNAGPLRVGLWYHIQPYYEENNLGFRVAQNFKY